MVCKTMKHTVRLCIGIPKKIKGEFPLLMALWWKLEYTSDLKSDAHCEIEGSSPSKATINGDVSLMVRHLFAKQAVDVNSVVLVRIQSSPPNGRIPKWSTGADCKSVAFTLRWFESNSAHHIWRVSLMVRHQS